MGVERKGRFDLGRKGGYRHDSRGIHARDIHIGNSRLGCGRTGVPVGTAPVLGQRLVMIAMAGGSLRSLAGGRLAGAGAPCVREQGNRGNQ